MTRIARMVVLGVVTLLVTAGARADWPMARHDPQRTAWVAGSSDIETPALRWRHYLGGALAASAYIPWDVDGDTLQEAVYVAGGKVLAKEPNGILLWETEPLGLYAIDGVYDFDGDGSYEGLLRGSRGRVMLAAMDDGRVLWEVPAGVLGEVGPTRVADLDGDRLPDLYVAECRCCTLNSGQIGAAYSFGAGFAPGAVVELWRLVGTVGEGACGAGGDTVADFDGSGGLELLYAGHTSLWGIDGATGTLAYRSAAMGSFRGGSASGDWADVDGDRRPELFLFEDTYQSSDSSGRRWVAMFDYDAPTDAMVRRWFREVTDPVADRHVFDGRSLIDADGDGTLEVVTSFYSGSAGRWTIYVYGAADGVELASLAGWWVAGIVDVTGDGVPEILGRQDDRLTCLQFTGGALTTLWTMTGWTPIKVLNRARLATRQQHLETAAQDVDGDGIAELLVQTLTDDPTAVQRLVALRADRATPVEAASYDPPPGIRLGSFAFSDGFTEPGTQLLAVRNDGYLVSFDRELHLTNFSDDPLNPAPGLRVGGYYSGERGIGHTPIVVAMGAGSAAAVVVRTSRGTLVRLDPSAASLVVPPAVVWERPVGWYPSALDVTGDATPEVVYWTRTRTTPAYDAVEAARIDTGAPVWTTAMGDATRGALHDLPYGDANADGTRDIFVHTSTTASVEEANVLNGRTGRRLWAADFTRAMSWGSYPKSVDDLDGDGRADLVGVYNSFLALSGATGAILRENPTFLAYLLPLVADVAADAGNEYFLHGGYYGSRLVRGSDFQPLWTAADARYSQSYGTLVRCGTAPRFVSGLFQSPELRVYSAPDGAVLADVWLAGGALFASEAAMRASGENPGFLTCITGTENLTGTGGVAVLAGSTDGWLYAVDPCSGALLWSLRFGFPVGEPVVSDTDGDGRNDVLVSVADGFLYEVGDEVLPAPEWVWDTDPPAGFPAEDRDTIETVDTLYASWAAVPGAASYEYGVVTPGGTFVTTPPFVSVGAATTAAPTGLPLRLGGMYQFVVRAVGPDGSSRETFSDGVQLVDESEPTIELRAAPNPFSPDGDGIEDTVTILADVADRVGLDSWNLAVYHPGGMAVARTFAPRPLAGTSTSDTVVWDGRDDSGIALPESVYPAVATVYDQTGHSATARIDLEIRFLPAADADADADAEEDAEVGADADAEAGADADADAEPEADAGADADADANADLDADASRDAPPADGGGDATAGGCGCRTAGSCFPGTVGMLLLGTFLMNRRRRTRGR